MLKIISFVIQWYQCDDYAIQDINNDELIGGDKI